MPAAFSDAAGIFVSLGGKARYPAAPPRLPVTAAFTRSRPQGGKPAIPQPPPEPASAAFYPFPPAGRKARHPAASAGTGVCRLLPVPARRAGRLTARQEKTSAGTGACRLHPFPPAGREGPPPGRKKPPPEPASANFHGMVIFFWYGGA